jgi:hypothetical protein
MKHLAMKISVFVLLLGLFYAWGGFALPHGAFDSPFYFKQNPVIPWALIILCFVYGDAVAVWGDKTVGIIHPISFRSGYIILGVLLMVAALLLTSCERAADSRRPNTALQPAATAPRDLGSDMKFDRQDCRRELVPCGRGSALDRSAMTWK